MGEIAEFLAKDHDRLDALFTRARADEARIDLEAYEAFRRGLLKHVGMEELILIPAARRLSGAAAALARQTRLDHAALTSLLIPTPTAGLLRVLHAVLEPHNRMEEEEGGLYDLCELVLGAEAEAILAKLRAAPDIPPAAHVDGPRVEDSIRRALAAAGYAGLWS
ncbi:MAG: hemerythrin domain-containing protein [Elusimicrobia bacterium]|nr:hemerythrin domain-containing protein [Elusimicrobiota bacterium]